MKAITWRAPVNQVEYLRDKEFLDFQMFEYAETDVPMINTVDIAPSHHIALFGTTLEGHSVCVIAKTHPVVTIRLPHTKFTAKLLKHIKLRLGLSQREVPFRVINAHSTSGFHPEGNNTVAFAKFPFLQLALSSMALVWRLRKLLMRKKDGKPVPGPFRVAGIIGDIEVVETMIPPVLQLIQQCDITPSSHVRVFVSAFRPTSHLSYCDIEGFVTIPPFAKPLSPIKPDPSKTLSNPVVVHSYDVEAICPGGGFPNPENPNDKIVSICSTTRRFGGNGGQLKVVHGLGDYHDVPDADFCFRYHTEKELLDGWCKHLREVEDPDIVLAFNNHQFDDWYINKRMAKEAPLGRLRHVSTRLDENSFQSAAHGSSNFKRFVIPGRVNVDLYTYMKRNFKLDNYKLATIATTFLPKGQEKDDLSIKLMMEYAMSGDPAKNMLVMKYCLQDTLLPVLLVDQLKVLSLTIEMSRVCSVFMGDILNRGQMFKVLCQLFRFARENNFVLTNLPKLEIDADTYQGATVLDCTTGFYDDCIVLDFQSLYPSIMIAYNLCFSTIVMGTDVHPGVQYHESVTDLGTFRVQQNLQGLLPRLLLKLLAARKVAKKDMAAAMLAGDVELETLMNGRQLALKVSCNSVYGFCGATEFGVYAYAPIAAIVTAEGRQLIQKSIVLAEANFPVKIVYGDTDSIFAHPLIKTAEDRTVFLFELGEAMSKLISSHFPVEIKLEFEKVYENLLLMGKKCYIGIKRECLEKTGKIDAKGFATVRRDFSGFVRNTLQNMVDSIVIRRDLHGAVEALHKACSVLLNNETELSQLVLTRKLASSYKNENTVQFQVAKKINKRAPGSAQVGDRLMYVMLAGKGEQYERGEDFEYARDNNLSLDKTFYLDSLKNPVEKLLGAFPHAIRLRANDVFRHNLAHANRLATNVADIRTFLGIPLVVGEKRVFSEKSEVSKQMSMVPSRKKKATTVTGCLDLKVFFANKKT